MKTDIFFIVSLTLSALNLILLIAVLWPRKIDKDVSRLLRRFEREKDCLVRIEMIESENVYLRNPRH